MTAPLLLPACRQTRVLQLRPTCVPAKRALHTCRACQRHSSIRMLAKSKQDTSLLRSSCGKDQGLAELITACVLFKHQSCHSERLERAWTSGWT